MSRSEEQPPREPAPGGITRREALKKGALLGGALAWATPVVQVIGMQPALAQTASPTCEIIVPGFGCIVVSQTFCDCLAACGEDDIACAARCVAALEEADILGGC